MTMRANATLHPQAEAILQRLIASGEPPMETLSPQAARAIADARVVETAGTGADVGAVTHHSLTVAGRAVTLRQYIPKDPRPEPLPIVVYFHGGGFVVGNLDTVDSTCRNITQAVGCIVVSVGYSLAPEQKLPAAIEDCYAATKWVAEHAAALGGDADRIAVAGESSGGMLAALVAQMAHRSGDFGLALQAMIYPMLDLNTTTASYERFADGFFLTRAKMRWFIEQAIAGPEQLAESWAAPWRAADLSGLPPAVIITAELDPLVDEGMAYARRLAEAGVEATAECYEGWPHGFVYWGGTEAQRRALDTVSEKLRAAFGR
jgi:acetyl esterase